MNTTTRPPVRRSTCLIVDDDQAFAEMAAGAVREWGGQAVICGSLSEARLVLNQKAFEIVLLDNHLPDGQGYEFFSQIARRHPETPVIMITGAPDLAQAVALTRNGLFEYLTKPVGLDALSACLDRAQRRLQSSSGPKGGAEWYGESESMRESGRQLAQAARHPTSTVLLLGETGTGKDLAAQSLHRLTHPDDSAPYIPVNCGALPAEMFEAELFGAERGAYTGADKRRVGLVAAAGKGTLFLDEIAEVPLTLQTKLLRLLESREFRPLGSTERQVFAGRFVAATNKSLPDEVAAGRFREDLLYRLDVFPVHLPPLRERRADIPGLAERLLADIAGRYQRTKPLLTPEDLSVLSAHDYPGNVRELRNVLERSLLKTPAESRWLALDANWVRGRANRPTPPAAAPTSSVPAAGSSPVANSPARELTPLEAQEYQLIGAALRECHGGIRRAAAKLGLSPQALLRRLEKWPELRPPANDA